MSKLDGLRDLFLDAHRGISFSPEVRADQCVKDFSDELDADLAALGENAGDYESKYIAHVRDWAVRKSRCLSPMITGPANFPVVRNRKAIDSEQNAWKEFREWRERYFRAVNRVRTKSPEEEIDDALVKLEKERNAHELMVGINKIVRRKIDDASMKKALVEELEISDALADKIMIPDEAGSRAFASYALTNSSARVRKLEEKILIMRSRIINRDAFEPIDFGGGSILIEDDRVVIRHDAKPPRETIEALKSHGFKYAPSRNAWVRKHTRNALEAAKTICQKKPIP